MVAVAELFQEQPQAQTYLVYRLHRWVIDRAGCKFDTERHAQFLKKSNIKSGCVPSLRLRQNKRKWSFYNRVGHKGVRKMQHHPKRKAHRYDSFSKLHRALESPGTGMPCTTQSTTQNSCGWCNFGHLMSQYTRVSTFLFDYSWRIIILRVLCSMSAKKFTDSIQALVVLRTHGLHHSTALLASLPGRWCRRL